MSDPYTQQGFARLLRGSLGGQMRLAAPVHPVHRREYRMDAATPPPPPPPLYPDTDDRDVFTHVNLATLYGHDFATGAAVPITTTGHAIVTGSVGDSCLLVVAFEDYSGSTPSISIAGASLITSIYNTSIVSGSNHTFSPFLDYAPYTVALYSYTITGSEPGGNQVPITFGSPGVVNGITVGIVLPSGFSILSGPTASVLTPGTSSTVVGSPITDEGNVLTAIVVGHAGPSVGDDYTVSALPTGVLESPDSSLLSTTTSLTGSVLSVFRHASNVTGHVGEMPSAGEGLQTDIVTSLATSFDGVVIVVESHRTPITSHT